MITEFTIFESFYEPQYSCVNLSADEFNELTRKDNTLKTRIRFFNYSDTTSWYDQEPRFTVLFADDLIIGVCKIDKYDNQEGDFSIAYFSIDRDFRNRKLTRLMIDTLFDFILDNDYSLDSSSWTYPGMTKLKPLIDSIAKERGVKWITNNKKHDAEWNYNDDFIHRNEMTDKEYKKHTSRTRKKFNFK